MHFVLQITVPNDCTELSVISESVKYAFVWRSRSRGRYAKMRADPRADTAEFSWQAQKRGRYDGTYARYRDFQYLTLSGEYLRICSCILHCSEFDAPAWAFCSMHFPKHVNGAQHVSSAYAPCLKPMLGVQRAL
jgi:hypothetical protein